MMRYKEANAQYQKAEDVAPHCIAEATCVGSHMDLLKIATAKGRLQARGSATSHELIAAELTRMSQEKQIDALRASPLFQPICLFLQEQRAWSGTPKQFKEVLHARFPETFATGYRSASRFLQEAKKIVPALQEEGIGVSIPPETALVILTKAVVGKPHDEEG